MRKKVMIQNFKHKYKNTIENRNLNFFSNNIRNTKKNARMQDCSFQLDLQILFYTVSDKIYIFRFNFNKIRLRFKNFIF